MKIILSRKGFDSTAGGYPNAILPDGTLLSLPIPAKENTGCRYSDISYDSKTYFDYINQLAPRFQGEYCHHDPDIRPGSRLIPEWSPAFGQKGSAQGVIRNAQVGVGDIFLFFGRFQKTKYTNSGQLSYIKDSPILHIIFGYLEIGEVLTDFEKIKSFPWHPHAQDSWAKVKNNTLYLPADCLTLASDRAGCGVFDYDEKYVLTKSGCSTATWKEKDFYVPDQVLGNRKNSAKGEGIYYAGQWQELVLHESLEATNWIKTLF